MSSDPGISHDRFLNLLNELVNAENSVGLDMVHYEVVRSRLAVNHVNRATVLEEIAHAKKLVNCGTINALWHYFTRPTCQPMSWRK